MDENEEIEETNEEAIETQNVMVMNVFWKSWN